MLRKIITVFLIGGMLKFGLGGCFGNTYKVNYNGAMDSFQGAKESYRAGERVKLSYKFIATDTDYSFYLDGEQLNPDYAAGRGYIIRFRMPQRDVSLRVVQRNLMLSSEYNSAPAKLSFHSFDGGGPEFTVRTDDDSLLSYDQTKLYSQENRDKIAGAAFTVSIVFFGLKPGTTTVTVESRSPIAENYDLIYDAEISPALGVTLTEREKRMVER